ncbi:phasin family protein [Marinobacteraceae bacterium S3BR75-40.1]
MAKKPNDENATEKQETENQLADRIKGSARQIWLAGLGAYTKAEEDAGRFFDRLVREGEDIENKTRGAVERQVKAVESRVGEVKNRATESWDRLESVFDQRVSRALQRLGISSHTEILEMRDRIEALEAEVAELKKKQGGQ